jgi:hypothetical protein
MQDDGVVVPLRVSAKASGQAAATSQPKQARQPLPVAIDPDLADASVALAAAEQRAGKGGGLGGAAEVNKGEAQTGGAAASGAKVKELPFEASFPGTITPVERAAAPRGKRTQVRMQGIAVFSAATDRFALRAFAGPSTIAAHYQM